VNRLPMPDQVTRVLAIRHGETAWNLATRIQGQLDIALNDTGHWQARRLALAVADAGLSALYASDLQRARKTAQAVAAQCGLAVVADAGLRERSFGIFEGRTYAEIEQHWPVLAQRWRRRDPDFGPDGGEALAAFYARSVACATRLAARHPGETIALVAHGGVMDCLYRAATRVSLQAPRTWQLGNAGINRLLYSPEGFTLVGWNDEQHLDGTEHDEDGDAGPRERAA
jgi:2,3-bisphosphoglycerate-dependent phosphoglycerate mutase